MMLVMGQGPDANRSCKGSGLGILLRLRLSHGHLAPWGLQGGTWGRRGGQVMGHSASPTAASILSVTHVLGVLDKTVFEKIEQFSSYKGSWESPAGVVADLDEVKLGGGGGAETGEV